LKGHDTNISSTKSRADIAEIIGEQFLGRWGLFYISFVEEAIDVSLD
jgi:hypothetical protein